MNFYDIISNVLAMICWREWELKSFTLLLAMCKFSNELHPSSPCVVDLVQAGCHHTDGMVPVQKLLSHYTLLS